MSFSIGIVGLPNVGKSTLFKALTKKQVDISNYPFCTIEPNVGVVAVPDERLDKLAEILKPDKKTPTIIEFVDIAGLVKDSHKGQGLGNQFLAQIREVAAILEVVRVFEDPNISHIDGRVNPLQDIETIKTELIMKDLETLERRLKEVKSKTKTNDTKAIKFYELLKVLENWLNQGNMAKDIKETQNYQEIFRELQLLTAKPIIYIFNQKSEVPWQVPSELRDKSIAVDLKLESDLAELTQKEIEEFGLLASCLDHLIKICYDTFDLVTFYTVVGGKEIRAWTVKRNIPIREAAGKIHTDFQEKFIKAEVINWRQLVDCGSWHAAREKGLIRTEGKEYLVQDKDVIEIKI